MIEKLKLIYESTISQIIDYGKLWSLYMTYQDILCLRPTDSRIQTIKRKLIADPFIHEVFQRLTDLKLGVPSLRNKPARHNVYGSYFWGLQFLSDFGLTVADLPLEKIIDQIFLYQLPDGQFTIGYRTKNKIPVSAICITAHLASNLAQIGYSDSRAVQAALRYIFTTRRYDGGWHCDLLKQRGEKDEQAPSCPIASLYVLRCLSFVSDIREDIVKPAINHVLQHWQNPQQSNRVCDFGSGEIYRKLRYPPHYWGYDLLHVLDTLSLFPQYCRTEAFDDLIRLIIKKWNEQRFFISEKTIPEWKTFDFANKNSPSCWISALICRVLKRVYF